MIFGSVSKKLAIVLHYLGIEHFTTLSKQVCEEVTDAFSDVQIVTSKGGGHGRVFYDTVGVPLSITMYRSLKQGGFPLATGY